jgi:hypothetical protein
MHSYVDDGSNSGGDGGGGGRGENGLNGLTCLIRLLNRTGFGLLFLSWIVVFWTGKDDSAALVELDLLIIDSSISMLIITKLYILYFFIKVKFY